MHGLELWFVRHGETEANRAGIIQGADPAPTHPRARATDDEGL